MVTFLKSMNILSIRLDELELFPVDTTELDKITVLFLEALKNKNALSKNERIGAKFIWHRIYYLKGFTPLLSINAHEMKKALNHHGISNENPRANFLTKELVKKSVPYTTPLTSLLNRRLDSDEL